MELCHLVYCLLSRSRRVSSLPNINAWKEYMDVSRLSQYDVVPSAEFLKDYDFGSTLRDFKGSEGRDFQDRCREFMDRFVELVLAQQASSSEFMSGLYCFCPELLLEGDDKHVFDLFNDWLDVWSIVELFRTRSASRLLKNSVRLLWMSEVVMSLVSKSLRISLMSPLICWEIIHFWPANTCAECLNCVV